MKGAGWLLASSPPALRRHSQAVRYFRVFGNGMTVRRPGRWTPAAWVLLLAFLVSPGVCTFSGPFPGPDNWADVPPATRRVSPQPLLSFCSPGQVDCCSTRATHKRNASGLLCRHWMAARLCTRCPRARRGACWFSCMATCSAPTSGASPAPPASTAQVSCPVA